MSHGGRRGRVAPAYPTEVVDDGSYCWFIVNIIHHDQTSSSLVHWLLGLLGNSYHPLLLLVNIINQLSIAINHDELVHWLGGCLVAAGWFAGWITIAEASFFGFGALALLWLPPWLALGAPAAERQGDESFDPDRFWGDAK